MIREEGRVIAVMGEGVVLVRCEKTSACAHCAAQKSCHTGAGDTIREIEVQDPLGVAVNDLVVIETSTRTFLSSSFILYAVPVIALLFGAIIGDVLARGGLIGMKPDLAAAALGILFLIGSMLTIRVLTRNASKTAYMPSIVSIIRTEGHVDQTDSE